MRFRSFAALIVLIGVISSTLGLSSESLADPSSDLAAAESSAASAKADVDSAKRAVVQAEKKLAPIAKRAEAADDAATEAVEKSKAVRIEVVSEREGAAREIEAAESDYDSEKSTHDTLAGVGIGIAMLTVLLALAAFAYSRFRKWPLRRRLTQILGGALALLFVGGLVLAFVPSAPQEPEFSDETMRLAAAAKGDPASPATPELSRARAEAKPLVVKSRSMDRQRETAEKTVEDAEAEVDAANGELSDAKSQVKVARKAVGKEEQEAAEEASFREEATSIPYGELSKNPERYTGDKVVYTGQIFQIQEFGGEGLMLLAVTDEGYGFWTDNIWVDFHKSLDAAEEDVITVYGKITGSKEYETQIGGSTYVPRMNAKYIDE